MADDNMKIPEKNKVLSVTDWLIIILLLAIPVVNIVMLFIWAFGKSAPLVKSNFAKAQLIWMAIFIILGIIFWGALGSIFLPAFYGY